jgi:hypothetical protein
MPDYTQDADELDEDIEISEEEYLEMEESFKDIEQELYENKLQDEKDMYDELTKEECEFCYTSEGIEVDKATGIMYCRKCRKFLVNKSLEKRRQKREE